MWEEPEAPGQTGALPAAPAPAPAQSPAFLGPRTPVMGGFSAQAPSWGRWSRGSRACPQGRALGEGLGEDLRWQALSQSCLQPPKAPR